MQRGQQMSAEARAHLSSVTQGRGKGVPKSPEHRAKIAAANTGKTHSPEAREKIRAARARQVITPEARAKTAAANRGRVQSPETRAKRSAAMMGHATSPEARAKMSVAHKGNRHAKNAPVLGECAYCFGPAQTHDHVIPRGRPGWDDPDNVVLACWACNAGKNNRTPEEWFAGEARVY